MFESNKCITCYGTNEIRILKLHFLIDELLTKMFDEVNLFPIFLVVCVPKQVYFDKLVLLLTCKTSLTENYII